MSEPIQRCCDLVMKGGITSGVVYPKVVEQVARRFHLVGVSGTSAGAIAASLAAAAEYRRRTQGGSFEGFTELGLLSDELAQKGRLLELFTPDHETRKSFKLLRQIIDNGLSAGPISKLLLRRRKYLQPLIENAYGLCSGMALGQSGVDPLTPWLSRQIDRIAGKEGGPLTFRDLHGASPPAPLEALVGTADERPVDFRAIDFRAVTTCVTFGRPYEFPLRTNIFAFDPDAWRRYFPEDVVAHLVNRGEEIVRQAEETGGSVALAADGKLPLTNTDLPLVVATRMSLSFPILLSMVPLWAIDYRRDPPHRLEPVWFSDGGLTSNFPLHRFDSLYPLWPTLGVTLANGAPDHPRLRRLGEERPGSPASLVYLPQRPAGMTHHWNRFDQPGKATSMLFKFLSALFKASQNWHDESFLTLPGYRGRSVEIWMGEGEGGLELDMEGPLITELSERGDFAGQQIATRFASDDLRDPMGWDAHRWTRFRAGMRALMDELEDLNRSVNATPMAGGVPVTDWLNGDATPPTAEIKNTDERQRDAEFLDKLLAACTDLLDKPRPFSGGPKPAREFATRAPMDR